MAITDRIKRKKKEAPAPVDYGSLGAPIDKSHPFYFGFIATLGALTAFILMRALASVTQILVLIIISLFLAMGLDPAVRALQRRGASRTGSVSVIFVLVILFVGIFAAAVIPPVISQGTHLINAAPDLLNNLSKNHYLASLNADYGIIETLQNKLKSITSNGTLIISAFGGVIGVGRSVLSGTFTALTILVLTLYFITSLPQATDLALRLVPKSRRPRAAKLTNAIISQVGAFVGSQIIIAFMASIFVTIMGVALGLPSPVAIGVTVLICALVPLIGHFLGCSVVTIIALTQSLWIGITAFLLYVTYVQVENYIITPKIMKRSLNVPGAVTIISALIGSSLLGLIGGLIAVPVAAALILIMNEVVLPRSENS